MRPGLAPVARGGERGPSSPPAKADLPRVGGSRQRTASGARRAVASGRSTTTDSSQSMKCQAPQASHVPSSRWGAWPSGWCSCGAEPQPRQGTRRGTGHGSKAARPSGGPRSSEAWARPLRGLRWATSATRYSAIGQGTAPADARSILLNRYSHCPTSHAALAGMAAGSPPAGRPVGTPTVPPPSTARSAVSEPAHEMKLR